MKKLVLSAMMSVFLLGSVSVMAQDTTTKKEGCTKAKTECTKGEKKSCCKDKKDATASSDSKKECKGDKKSCCKATKEKKS